MQFAGVWYEAERYFREALETQRRVLGDDHPSTLRSMNELGRLLHRQGRLDQAETMFLAVIEKATPGLGERHRLVVSAVYDLACIAALRGDREQALDWLRQAVEAGYSNADWIPKDSDLETLHGPEFDALVERARENAAALRAE